MPRTRHVTLDRESMFDLDNVLDGKDSFAFTGLSLLLHCFALQFGYPVFLRTGQTSHKHDWKNTCFVKDKPEMESHIVALLKFSHVADIIGLDRSTWVVREMLDLKTAFTSFYGDMPINCERRYFIRDGKVECHHPYWPKQAFDDYSNPLDWESQLTALNYESLEEVDFLTEQSLKVAEKFKGYWSLDWALATDGTWYAIDMAPGDISFHWDGCEKKGGSDGNV